MSKIIGSIKYFDSGEVIHYTDENNLLRDYKSDIDCRGLMAQKVINIPDGSDLRVKIGKIHSDEFGL